MTIKFNQTNYQTNYFFLVLLFFKLFIISILLLTFINIQIQSKPSQGTNSASVVNYSNSLAKLSEVQKSNLNLNSQPNVERNEIRLVSQNNVMGVFLFENYTLNIPKIGLNNSVLEEGSLRNIPDIDNKLLYNAVIENQVADMPCTQGHSYIYGHSEPADSWQEGYPASYIFNQLHTLKAGDRIEIKDKSGITCSYEVTHWEEIETTPNQTLTREKMNFVFNPQDGTNLTIQTCKLGSPTVRKLLRARLVDDSNSRRPVVYI